MVDVVVAVYSEVVKVVMMVLKRDRGWAALLPYVWGEGV